VDEGLITVKGLNALKMADVVMYDALVNRELLRQCHPSCELVYVGKKPGIHSYQQIYINSMIVDYGSKYENIVRLKGGDPFVFGRGHEELEHAKMHGMEVEVIPGISSAIAVPEMCEIPLTKRGVNESFWVITGTTSALSLSSDVHLAAQSSSTIVILMGMNHLDQIVDIFRQWRGENEHIGIIQNGTKENQQAVFTQLHDVERQVAQSGISSPAIIVIGEVVKLHKSSLLEELKEELAF